MADFTRQEIEQRVKDGKGLERSDLRGVDLGGAALAGGNFRGADMSGANLEGAHLEGATLSRANLSEAYLQGAKLAKAKLDNADLDGANAKHADFSGADLSRSNLEGAKFEGAILCGARLKYAQIASADFGGADLAGAILANTDLTECYLGGAKAKDADFTGANLGSANLEEGDFANANFDDADMPGVNARKANFAVATLRKADLTGASLDGANFSACDLRRAVLVDAVLEGAKLTGALVFGVDTANKMPKGFLAEWIDASEDADGSGKISGEAIANAFLGVRTQAPTQGDGRQRRFFGAGDVLRNATLEFGEHAYIEIESRFEACSIQLGKGAELIVGKGGELDGCQISGGSVTVHGRFFEGKSPGFVEPSKLHVGAGATVVAAVRQAPGATRFGFEPGCHLRIEIMEATRSVR